MKPIKTINTQKIIGILLAVISGTCLVAGIILFVSSYISESSKPLEKSALLSTADEPASKTVKSTGPTTTSADESSELSSFSETTASEDILSQNSLSASGKETFPDDMLSLLAKAGYDQETLSKAQTDQLVVVDSLGTTATIHFFEKTDNAWKQDISLTCQGFVGLEGTVFEMSEQISGTPKGLYSIGSAFYQNDVPQTGLETFHITNETYWIDDPDSAFYNQHVEGTEQMDWNSSEKMSDISGYKYGFVINYNMPAEYNKGSAIFFHIGYGPTGGCVATSEDMVLAYLAKLNAGSNPYILVI